jgi:glycosyltransferase involved in cell wall biosynthesis
MRAEIERTNLRQGETAVNSNIEPLDVDVVVPVRDGARFLPSCLDGIAAQTLRPRAIIVVDDGSTDLTPQILAEYALRWPSLQIIRSEPRGVSHARNLGLSACQASFVAFLDADDVWEATKLERQMALFAEDRPRLGFVHCAYRLIDEAGQPVTDHPILDPRKCGDIFSELLSHGNIVSGSGSAVIVRRKLLDLVGGFDERLFFGEDWDLWLRLASVSEIDFVPERLVAIRTHEHSAQRRRRVRKAELFLFQDLLILDRWYGTERSAEGLRERYREVALSAATMRQSSHVFSVLKNDWRFYTELKCCGSRLGCELFSGPVDFHGSMFFRRLMAGLRAVRIRLRRLAVSVLKSILPPAKFEALRESVRSRRKAKAG